MTLPSTIAGRVEVVRNLLHPEITDDEGNILGYGEPMITMEEAVKLIKGEPINVQKPNGTSKLRKRNSHNVQISDCCA